MAAQLDDLAQFESLDGGSFLSKKLFSFDGDQIFPASLDVSAEYYLPLAYLLPPHSRCCAIKDQQSTLVLGDLSRPYIAHQDNPYKTYLDRIDLVRPALMGAVNVTPDSFSDGGRYLNPEKAIEQVEQLVAEGAFMVDIGGHSTAFSAHELTVDEELRRLRPVFDGLKSSSQMMRREKSCFVSVDTYSAKTAYEILSNYPVDMINDVSGLRDTHMAHLVKDSGVQVCIGHALSMPAKRGEHISNAVPVVNTIKTWVEGILKTLDACKIDLDKVWLDPGLGFGKDLFQSIELCRQVAWLQSFGFKVLYGHSRKSMLTSITKNPPLARDAETSGLSCALAQSGVDMIRVHNVQENRQTLLGFMLGSCS